MARQYSLQRIFVLIAVLAMVMAFVSFLIRKQPDRLPEAMMLRRVDGVEQGMPFEMLCGQFGFEPNANWLDESGSGYAVWRFEVSDVPYSLRRASYFVKFDERAAQSWFLLYPVESSTGGMVF